MRRIIGILALSLMLFSCEKANRQPLAGLERDILELKIDGQMGRAVLEKDDIDEVYTATIYILEQEGYDYSHVTLKGISLSYGASASISEGQTLDFSNPQRRARISVISASGLKRDWWIYLKTYDPFFLGKWKVTDAKLCCDQNVAGCGNGKWETQLKGGEFGSDGLGEYDNLVTIKLEGTADNALFGTFLHEAGPDGLFGDFHIVISPYTRADYLDMNPRLRHLMPPGESEWRYDLTTQKMTLTQGKLSSVLSFEPDDYGNMKFNFRLPSAVAEPSLNGTYDNMWRSSTDFYYAMYKISE